MQSFNKKASGTLRFSVSPAKSTFFINTYLRPFAAAYPEICFQFREEAVSAQTRHIAENSSDFAFANAPLPSPQLFAAHKTQKEYFYAVYSPQANCGLDPQQPLTPKQLQTVSYTHLDVYKRQSLHLVNVLLPLYTYFGVRR